MNERIKELAKEAGLIQYDTDGKMEDVEKFAQLIVKECGVVLSLMLRDMISRGQAYDMIKQHFGVEE